MPQPHIRVSPQDGPKLFGKGTGWRLPRLVCQSGQAFPGLHLNWKLVLTVLAIYLFVALKGTHRAGELGNGWRVVDDLFNPVGHVFGAAVLVPLAWRGRYQGWRFPIFLKRLILAFLASEVACTLLVFIDWWLRRKAGLTIRNISGTFQNYLFIVGPAMTAIGGLIAARASALEENKAVREEAQIATTRLLQSQLHPHVLFNALNGLAELVLKDHLAAERSIRHLANLLRRILQASEVPTFSLGEERALVEDFLSLEGLRLGSRLRITWKWDDSLDACQVPPLLLQPLVENAIKHGISPSPAGGELAIRMWAQGQDLHLEVWNSGEPYRGGPSTGIGLHNLKARLALFSDATADFAISASMGGTLASISLKNLLV